MTHTFHNLETLPPPQGRYSQAIEVRPGARYPFIAGQVGMTADGTIPDSFEEQCRQIYATSSRCWRMPTWT
jgi:2-iminobutanoate/2-iminopropanoate deaminase